MKRFFFFVFLLCNYVHAQNPQLAHVDLWKGKTAATQVRILDSLSKAVRTSDYKQALAYSQQGLQIAQKNQLHDGVAKSWLSVAQAYKAKGLFDSALIFLDSARFEATTYSLKKLMPEVLNAEGAVYMRKSNNTKATSCFYEAIELANALKDSVNLQMAFNYLGTVAFYRDDFLSAANFYRRSRNFVDVQNKPEKFVSITDNIGLCYANVGKYDSALFFQEQAVKKLDQINDSNLRAEVFINIAATLLLLNRIDESKHYIDDAFQIHQKRNNGYGLVLANHYLGKYYLGKNDLPTAIRYLEIADQLANELDIASQKKQTGIVLAEVYSQIGDHKRASEKYAKLIDVIQEINKDENARAINELSAQYDYKEQTQKIELLTRDKAIQDQRIENDRNLKIIYASVAVFLLLLSGLFIYRFIEKKKANRQLVEQAEAIALQKKKIEEQKAQLQQRNQETMDSINYASRIQRSSLPSLSLLQATLNNSFVYYKPKDIVSGDFYWMREKIVPATSTTPERRYLYFAVADCTGHGVPGAMMAVLGSSLLNQLIAGPVVKQPAAILHELHIQVVASLNEDLAHRDSHDGMDIALLLLDLSTKRVTYAGAGRPLYYQNGTTELQTIRSDKYSVGDTTDMEQIQFTQHEIAVLEPTMFYLSTDGVVDQFGGPFARKFMTKNLKEMLHEIAPWPIEKQAAHVQTVLDTWKEGHDQTDDITLVGFRLG